VLINICTRPGSLVEFFIEVIAALALYAGLAFVVCVGRHERRAFLQVAGKFRLRPARS